MSPSVFNPLYSTFLFFPLLFVLPLSLSCFLLHFLFLFLLLSSPLFLSCSLPLSRLFIFYPLIPSCLLNFAQFFSPCLVSSCSICTFFSQFAFSPLFSFPSPHYSLFPLFSSPNFSPSCLLAPSLVSLNPLSVTSLFLFPPLLSPCFSSLLFANFIFNFGSLYLHFPSFFFLSYQLLLPFFLFWSSSPPLSLTRSLLTFILFLCFLPSPVLPSAECFYSLHTVD